MATIIETPQSLHRRAAKSEGEDISLTPEQIRQISDWWWADQQKIKYLESLIVRMGKANESVVTLKCDVSSPELISISRLLEQLNSGENPL